ncbi:uncharacterized protein Triagg1_6003 [Trichoderma aggressivum f. europaeum]|uniref:Nucleoside phosphorylase domain-containing protein n=1 Tax=Trichoderma aggressivum f. europaeum TaxID=173218 RepID=A0AAE1ICH2_9HYPO|nr:hypothetical protein Triagg1_6003 [Trichoderma aggressivum f. europaeum]
MATARKTHDDYTIGWVATLGFGVSVFRALLDEEHESLPQDDRDDNSYVLGRMGSHNVVLAYPGESKTALGAEILSHMAYSFPKIQLRLIVGVGGGAPQPIQSDPKKDIRLGDVVVGFPNGDNNCVVQWEKSTGEEGSFVAKCHLHGPPPVLINAIKALQSAHQAENGNMQQYIDQVLQSTSPGMETIKHPGFERDRLFRSGYMHKGGEQKSADVCAACDKGQIIQRTPREPSHVMVHYGQIASSNKVMKTSKKRDSLRKEWGVLCFEMEAAGLTDEFPFLLIRGVCDYSDSHKDKKWRSFASLTAAAYAKDLLMVLPSQEDGAMPLAVGSAGEESQVGKGLGVEEASESNRGSETERETGTERDSASGMSGMSGESGSDGEWKAKDESNTTDGAIRDAEASSPERERSSEKESVVPGKSGAVEESGSTRGSKAPKKSKMPGKTKTTKENKADKSEISGDAGLGGEPQTEGRSEEANNAEPQVESGSLKKSKTKKGGTGKKLGSVRVQEAGQEAGSATESLASKAPPKEPGTKKKAGAKSKGASKITREDGTMAKAGTTKKAGDSSSAVTTGGGTMEAMEAMAIGKTEELMQTMEIGKIEEAIEAITVGKAGEAMEAIVIGKTEEAMKDVAPKNLMGAATTRKTLGTMQAVTATKLGETIEDKPAKKSRGISRAVTSKKPSGVSGVANTKTGGAGKAADVMDFPAKGEALVGRPKPKQEPKPEWREAKTESNIKQQVAISRVSEATRTASHTRAEARSRFCGCRGRCWTLVPALQCASATDLSEAVKSGNLWKLRVILHMGVDPNIAEHHGGQSALHEAAYWNHPNAAMIIMGFMGTCDIHARNHEGLTALEVARKRGSEDVVRLLENYR